VFAALILKEHVHVYRWSAVVVGFVGVILMLTPYFRDHAAWTSSAGFGVGLAFVNAFCNGGATIQIRRITATERTITILIYMIGIVMLASLVTLPFGWLVPDSAMQWAVLIGIGVAGGTAQILFTDSYRHAPASFLAPFDYVSMLWAFIAGYWIFGEVPTPYVIIGAVIVAGAGIFVILRERRLGLKRLRDTPVAAISSMADPEPDPDAPVTELVKAS
ncbi:MAG TPA: DMT family transporter, partial [Afipia sp.]